MPTVTDEEQLLVDLATGLWRLRRRVAGGGAEPGLARGLRRDLDALADRLAEAGYEIIDHTDELYDPGKSLRVLAFQPAPGTIRETVGETLKPTIYHRGRWLQMGEVIVNIPPPPETAP